jgi:hypothetical protein
MISILSVFISSLYQPTYIEQYIISIFLKRMNKMLILMQIYLLKTVKGKEEHEIKLIDNMEKIKEKITGESIDKVKVV